MSAPGEADSLLIQAAIGRPHNKCTFCMVHRKGPADLTQLKNEGLTRIQVGLESGDDEVLARSKKGTDSAEQIQAGVRVRETGIGLSE